MRKVLCIVGFILIVVSFSLLFESQELKVEYVKQEIIIPDYNNPPRLVTLNIRILPIIMQENENKEKEITITVEEIVEDKPNYGKQFSSNHYSKEDLYWLSRIVSTEAKGESAMGQLAVANVVLNRVVSDKFPNTVKGVIFQKGQFCPVKEGTIYNEPTKSAIENAKLALEGKRIVKEDVYYFYNPQVVSRGSWIRSREVYKQIGNHNFAK